MLDYGAARSQDGDRRQRRAAARQCPATGPVQQLRQLGRRFQHDRPLFDTASTLKPNSPVKAEAAKIAAASSDPVQRTEAALRLVQDASARLCRLDGANYRPATADETWDRRFGDQRRRSAAWALLRELGVPAQPVLVNALGGDEPTSTCRCRGCSTTCWCAPRSPARPTGWMARAWATGAWTSLPPPVFRWALPVHARRLATLERVDAVAPTLAQNGLLLEIDARKGFDTPAKVSAERIYRGDTALLYKTQLAQMSKEDAERALRAYWTEAYDWIEADTVAWRYDEAQNLTVLTVTGEEQSRTGRATTRKAAASTSPARLLAAAALPPPQGAGPDRALADRFPGLQAPDHGHPPAALRHQGLDLSGVPDGREDGRRHPLARRRPGGRGAAHHDEQARPEAGDHRRGRRRVNKQLPSFDNKISIVYQYDKDAVGDVEPDLEGIAGKDPEKLAELAEYLQMKGKTDRALRTVDKALAIDPKSVLALKAKLESRGDQPHQGAGVRGQDRQGQPLSGPGPGAGQGAGAQRGDGGRLRGDGRGLHRPFRRRRPAGRLRQPGPRTPPSGPCRRSRLDGHQAASVQRRPAASPVGGVLRPGPLRRGHPGHGRSHSHGARAAHQPAQSRLGAGQAGQDGRGPGRS